MQGIDKQQQLTINIILASVGVLTALTGIMAYRDNKKHQKVQQELFAIDREIKMLNLANEKAKARQSGLV